MTPAAAYSEATKRVAQLAEEISENDITRASRLVARAAVLHLHEHVTTAELSRWMDEMAREFNL